MNQSITIQPFKTYPTYCTCNEHNPSQLFSNPSSDLPYNILVHLSTGEKKRVEAAGGQVLKNRVQGVLAISRAFGDTRFKDGDSSAAAGVYFASTPTLPSFDIHSHNLDNTL